MTTAAARAPALVFLTFRMGGERYAVDAQRVREVLPLVALKKLPQAPRGVAGLFDYRGAPVPVIDLSELTVGTPAPQRLGTRLVLVDYPGAGGERHLLGLIVERATETLRRDRGDFVDGGVSSTGAPYLGPVCTDAQGMIQWITVERLLPPEVRDSLFRR